jgi:hypothetical protein
MNSARCRRSAGPIARRDSHHAGCVRVRSKMAKYVIGANMCATAGITQRGCTSAAPNHPASRVPPTCGRAAVAAAGPLGFPRCLWLRKQACGCGGGYGVVTMHSMQEQSCELGRIDAFSGKLPQPQHHCNVELSSSGHPAELLPYGTFRSCAASAGGKHARWVTHPTASLQPKGTPALGDTTPHIFQSAAA